MREKKIAEHKESCNERIQYLSDLIERDDLIAFCDAIKKDVLAMGAKPRDVEIIDYFRGIVHDQGVSREAKEIAINFLKLIYGLR